MATIGLRTLELIQSLSINPGPPDDPPGPIVSDFVQALVDPGKPDPRLGPEVSDFAHEPGPREIPVNDFVQVLLGVYPPDIWI